MEQWLLNNSMQILLILGGGVYAFMRLKTAVGKMDEQSTELEKKLQAHISAELPHTACALEQQNSEHISESLKDIKADLKALNSSFNQFVRSNGKKQ